MNTHLHFLHLKKREDRLENIYRQVKEQGIESYSIHEGIEDLAAVFRGISQGHNRIVMLAKQQKFENVIIAEDDVQFTSPNAWKYFLEQLELNKTADIFLSMIYEGEIDKDNRVIKNPKSFSGLTLYSVNSKFYDKFLSLDIMSHKDRKLGELSDQYDFRVCPEFCTKQLNGYSDQKKRYCYYDRYLKGRKIYQG